MLGPLVSRSVNPADRYELPTLEELLYRPAWHADALCREYPDVDWFVDSQQDRAKAICRRCLVRAECAVAGVEGNERGVWGGLTKQERRQIGQQAEAA